MPCQETIKKHVEFSNLKCEKSSEEKLFCYDAAGKCHVRSKQFEQASLARHSAG